MYTGTNGTTATYYFRRNLLGDVIGIYDTNGAKVGGYAYDAWGNCTITLNTNGIATKNPIRYRGYYYDQDTGLYYLNARYYSPEWRRFISPDDTAYLDPDSFNGLNLYCYCNNDPVNYADPSGHMPEWAQRVVCGLAISGLVVATVLTCGVAGAGAAIVGAAMLAGGLISGGITAIDQLRDTGTIDLTSVAISILSGTAYGLVIGLTGGAGTWAIAGKLAVAGGTSLLNSWNEWDENSSFGGMMVSLGFSLAASGIAHGAGYLAGKFGAQILPRILPRNPKHIITMGDIGSALWSIPAVKVGSIRFISGIFGSIISD